MKFYDINEAVKDEMRLDPGLVTDGERVRFMNDCLDEIGGLQLIELNTDIANCTDQYPVMPAGLTKVRVLRWDGVKLSPMDATGCDLTSTGVPVGYVMEGGRVRLFPKPAAAGTLSLVYTGVPTHCTTADLTENAGTSPAIPENWHRVLVDYACARSHRKNGNIVMANTYKNDYNLALGSCIRTYMGYLNSQVSTARSPQINSGW